ncbi:MAG: hypothetical protein MZV64_59040 [Ignavibacteriales bacterium]|nr:hypothetical protein [Ignavibacteriales bacterium]
MIHKPPLLFLDEPTSGLDPEAAQQVNDLIARPEPLQWADRRAGDA